MTFYQHRFSLFYVLYFISLVSGHGSVFFNITGECYSPPSLGNGNFTVNELRNYMGRYPQGTVATYICSVGYYLIPAESKLRVCEEGIWTGSDAKCFKHHNALTGCERPLDVKNGYYVFEKHDQLYPFGFGQRLHYSCREGYILEGNSVQQCRENGYWSPKIQPLCWKPSTGEYNIIYTK